MERCGDAHLDAELVRSVRLARTSSKRITRRRVLAAAGASVVAGRASARSQVARTGGGGGTSPVVGGNPFILTVTPGTGRTDSYEVGFRLTIGSTPLTATQVGHYVGVGSVHTNTHTVTIYDIHKVPLASAVIDTAGATPGQFAYAALSTPVVLWDGGDYYVMSTEGGDTWYNNDTVVTTAADAAISSAVYRDRGNGWLNIVAGGPYVPPSFKYDIGVAGGITRRGSPFAVPWGSDSVYRSYTSTGTIVTGTVTFTGTWIHGPSPNPGESITYQWIMDGVPISPVLTESPAWGLSWVCDTVALGIPDGTHVIYPRVLDSSSAPISGRLCQSEPIIVANHGFNNGTQTVPVVSFSSNRAVPPRPDFVTYKAGNPNPVRTSYPMPYTYIPGANDPASPYHSNPALLRDLNNWHAELTCGPRTLQYLTQQQWVTTPSGGVYARGMDPASYMTNSQSYQFVVLQNPQDGTRLNGLVGPYTNYIEDPAISGAWWGVEISGRVFVIDRSGTVTTVIGRRRDPSQLTLDPYYPAGITEAQIETRMTVLGNFPPGAKLGGANDLCFDPRNWNILYVVAQLDNWIARIDLSTHNVTVYAGTPGAPDGYTGDGGLAANATFAQPTSIIMDPTGIMYMCELNNSAIRKILPGSGTAAGTISTLCGGSVGRTHRRGNSF